MNEKKRRITAEDLYNFELISGMELAPDGKHVAFAQQRIEFKTQKKYSNLWIIDTEGDPTWQFTYGDQTDRSPQWSPDGSRIAFLSNRKNEKQFQIYLISFQGGEARPLTDLKGQFGSFQWSPDGKHIVCQFRKTDPEILEREADEDKKKLGVVERHYPRLAYKFDGAGYLPKERWHIWVINAENGEARQLTEGETFDETSPTWSPDGKAILFTSNRDPNPDIHYDFVDLYTLPFKPGQDTPLQDQDFHKVETPQGPKQSPVFSPDGKWIAYFGREGHGEWWRNNSLWVVPTQGSAPAVNLTGKFDLHVAPDTLNDTDAGAIAQTHPTWSPDSQRIYFQVTYHGGSSIQSIDITGENLDRITKDIGTVGVFSFDDQHYKLAYFFCTMTDPGQIWIQEGQEAHPRTDLNAWLKEVDLGEVEEIWFEGRDSNRLQGWVLKPPEFDSTRRYPSILEIHGGPMTQYGHAFMHEFYFLASQDYVVYFSNPRGGRGYGEDHTKAIYGNWGDADYADLMLWADLIKTKPYIDPERMGVTGGSYGGYMTLWVIGHTHQFQAAVAQRVVSNFISMWGSSDMNWKFQHLVGDPAPFEDIQTAWDHSPAKYLSNAQTPTLIIHSEEDHRCPIEQGEQAFAILKVNGVDSEMVRFPGEPHGLSRTGRTDRRIARLNHILRWMDGHLKPPDNP